MKKSVCTMCLALTMAACAPLPPAPPSTATKPAAQPPAEVKPPAPSSTRNAYAQKSRSTVVARQARVPKGHAPISEHAPKLAQAQRGAPDPVLEDAVLCKSRMSLFGYEKYLRDANIIDGEASGTAATRLFLPSRPVTVLGQPVGKLVLAGDDESDYAQLLILVNSQADSVAAAVRNRHVKLAKSSEGYRSARQPQGVVLVHGRGPTTTISCGYQPG